MYGVNGFLYLESIKNCPAKLMNTGNVKYMEISGRPFTSRSVENVLTVQEILRYPLSKKNRLNKQLVKVDQQGLVAYSTYGVTQRTKLLTLEIPFCTSI